MKYTIRVNNTINNTKWYYTRANRTFVAVLKTINGKRYFVIDDLHKIPSEYAIII
jgi:hypothetical protein